MPIPTGGVFSSEATAKKRTSVLHDIDRCDGFGEQVRIAVRHRRSQYGGVHDWLGFMQRPE